MSQRIDRFIHAMFKKQADQLLFGTGTPVRIRKDGVEKVILAKEVRTEQILKLLGPICGGRDAELSQDGEVRFIYASPDGAVQVQLTVQGDRMVAVLVPAVDDVPGVVEDDAPLDIMGNLAPEPAQVLTPAMAPPVAPTAAPEPAPVAAAPVAPVAAPLPVNTGGEPMIDKVLRKLYDMGGSDLHMTAGEVPRIRKDGDIQLMPGMDVLSGETIAQWMHEVAHETARGQFANDHDADFAYEIAGIARFRMNWFLDRNGPGAVMRTIPAQVLTADQLGLPPVVRGLCELPKGLVVVTGPTGSGKSTTLAAMVDLINKTRADHIITIEDPVEFVHKSIKCLVNQREVHTHTNSFSSALRAALREDPDIVLVGEMRDLETVAIAIETAETGHLVFGTLHTNTAPSTVDRIIDQFPTDQQEQIRAMLAESLRGVIAQTLCKKIGGGRVACLEILVVNNAISNLIREGKTFQIPSIMQTNKGIGMLTQTDSMMKLVKDKQISPREAYMKAIDQAPMKSALERANYSIDDNG